MSHRTYAVNLWSAIVLAGAIALSAASSASAADWQGGAGPEWQKIFEAAKQEGALVVAGPPQLSTNIAAAYQRDTGLNIQFLGGEARTTSSRLAREMRAKSVTIDATFTGMVELPLVKEGFFEDIKSRLILPSVTAPENWMDGQIKFNDNTGRYMLQTHSYRSAVPFFNPKVIKPSELTSWQDLLEPKYKGKIAVYDPRNGGPGQAMSTYIASQLSIDYLTRLYVGQSVVYSLDSRQMAEWVVRGVYPIALGVLTPDYLRYKNAGIDTIAPSDFSDGPGTLSGGFSVVLLPKGAPHPNAATVFVNWFASQPGQEAFSRAYNVPSRRLDVKVETVPEYTIPKPGFKYQDQYNEEWATTGRPLIEKQVTEAIGGK